jgi:hypothetical protein
MDRDDPLLGMEDRDLSRQLLDGIGLGRAGGVVEPEDDELVARETLMLR